MIRSLARAGYTVIVGRSYEKAFTEFSHYVSEAWEHPEIGADEGKFIKCLKVFLAARKNIRAVYPVGEIECACLHRFAPQITPLAAIISTETDTFDVCLDKQAMYRIAESLEIQIPKTVAVKSTLELYDSAEILGYPCVVKPNDALRPFEDQKAVICNSLQDLKNVLPVWPLGNEHLLVQKYIAGPRHNCHFFAIEGVVHLYFEHVVLRTDNVNGTGYGVENSTVIPSTVLQEYCSVMVEQLNYSGVGCAQFIVSPEGKVYFLEINPRLDANCAIPYYFGYDFPRVAADYTINNSVPLLSTLKGYPAAKRAHWLFGDIHGLLYAKKVGILNTAAFIKWLFRMFKAFLHADMHITWSWRDPLPSLYLYNKLFSAIPRKLLRTAFQEAGMYWRLIFDWRTPVMARFCLIATIIFIIWPCDIIKVFPGCGILDDVIIVSTLILTALMMIPEEESEDIWRRMSRLGSMLAS